MAETFCAELVIRSGVDPATSRLEISLCDTSGKSQTLSLAPDAVTALANILRDADATSSRPERPLTKMPKRYAVGRGRHEAYVLLRFEDEPAYGLSAAQAAELSEALLEEAEAVADTRYSLRQ
jgi:hypothetical protein